MNLPTGAPFRVFISYSHLDRDIADEIAAILKKDFGLIPVWDMHLRPGQRFSDGIKDMIASSHVFMPLLTDNSTLRPWVHQETGYAYALDVPVLPLAIGCPVEEMATTAISELHAVELKSPQELKTKLKLEDFHNLVAPPPPLPKRICHEAYWPEERTELLARYANLVVSRDDFSIVRQIGALTSFCIPDADLQDEVWKLRDGTPERSGFYHHLQREERRALEQHVKAKGCKLVIYPHQTYSGRGEDKAESVREARLQTLIDFLESMLDQEGIDVLLTDVPNDGNLTIVGNWFVAESLLPGVGGYRQTLFKWHAPTVYQRIQEFDRKFEELRPHSPKTLPDVIAKLKTLLPPSKGPTQTVTKRKR